MYWIGSKTIPGKVWVFVCSNDRVCQARFHTGVGDTV